MLSYGAFDISISALWGEVGLGVNLRMYVPIVRRPVIFQQLLVPFDLECGGY